MPMGHGQKPCSVNQIQVQNKGSRGDRCQKLAGVRETTQLSGHDIGKEPQIIVKVLACFMPLRG